MAHTEQTTAGPHTRHSGMQECIQNCRECEAACLALIDHCLKKGGPHADVEHIRTLLDCAKACETSASFMMRGSQLHKQYCAACVEACTRCADDCAKFQDDEEMQRCAEICRRCAESCKRMAAGR